MKNFLPLLLLVALCNLFSVEIKAQSTPKVSVQGTLKTSIGTAVEDGTYSLKFKLYSVSTGGSALWTETEDVNIVGGVYSHLLGSVNPLNPANFGGTLFLGVTPGAGAELSPRTEMTYAPYALSVAGIANNGASASFNPSGTLLVSNGMTVTGTTTSTSFSTNGGNFNGNLNGNASSATNATNATNANFAGGLTGTVTLSSNIFNSNSFTYFRYGNNDKMRIDDDGIDVYGSVFADGTLSLSGSYGWLNSAGNTGSTNSSGSYSVNAVNRVKASEFNAYSDRRIKKDLQLSDCHSDLAILKKLRVTDYRHIDELKNGSSFKKGFIAQEVETVFPQAVTKTSDFIPNIYEKAISCSLSGENMTVVLPKNHDLKVGDEVRLMLPNGKQELKVANVSSENTFTVEGWKTEQPEWVFAYGKKVEDFRQVDYDRIHTLNVSATQELIARVEQLEKENAALQLENKGLRTQSASMESRLSKVEAMLNGDQSIGKR
ncbi:MAG: tail fiber domain-containing protein [Saprospiraceae bacterium]|nr:tail fiber domain-containing protein [Saprospiraceae bacterium]